VEAHYAEQAVSLHDVYYERGTGARRRELEIISQPRAQAAEAVDELRTLVRRYGWPSYRIRLANGERATVYTNLSEGRSPVVGFTVVTARTAVTVRGGFRLRDIAAFAGRLRPLGR